MDTLYRDVAGLDVHKDSVVACVRHQQAEGGKARAETRTFAGPRRASCWSWPTGWRPRR